MFQACHAHHQEKNFINTASGNCHSVLVAVSTQLPTESDNYQKLYWYNLFSTDDEHDMLETRKEL